MILKVYLAKAEGGFIPLKEADGKIRVSSNPYLYDIAEGVVEDHFPLNKFGFNTTLATSYEDIWDGSAVYIYPASAVELHCSSSDNGDTQTIEVEGLNAGWQPQTATQSLAGQTETTIGTGITWQRVFRVKNSGATDFAGTVYIYEDDTVQAGVPDTASKIRAEVIADNNQTLMALWTVPVGMTAFMVNLYASTSSTKLVTVGLFIRPFGGVFQIKHIEEFTATRFEHKFDIPLKIEAKSDIALRAKVTVAGGDITAGFDLWYEMEHRNNI